MPSRHITIWEHILGHSSPAKEISAGTTIISDAGGCRRVLTRTVSCGCKEAPCAVGEGRGRLALAWAAAAFTLFSIGLFICLLIVFLFTSVFRGGSQRWLRIWPLGLDGCWGCRQLQACRLALLAAVRYAGVTRGAGGQQVAQTVAQLRRSKWRGHGWWQRCRRWGAGDTGTCDDLRALIDDGLDAKHGRCCEHLQRFTLSHHQRATVQELDQLAHRLRGHHRGHTNL